MKSLVTFAAILLSGCVNLVVADDASYYACYSSAGSMKEKNETEFQSMGSCRETCVAGIGYNAMAMTKGTVCYCGQNLPATADKVDDDKCSKGCGGYGEESCGDRLGNYFSVYLTGLEKLENIEVDTVSSSSSASKTSTSSSSTSTSSTSATSDADKATATAASSGSSSGGVNKAGVAAGAVIGVLAVVAIAAGAFIFLRNRRRQRIEEEYRRSAAVREFTKKPEQDHRLDPAMIQRRDSVGSIADNQDYSRRILKVTNPDGN